MADIKNKNELKRRIELFMDELDYSVNKDYCMETMRMMREFIGHASHRLDCANSKNKSLMAKLREYQKLEEQGLLLRLPVAIGQTVYTNYSMQGWYCRSSSRPYEAEVVYIGLNNCEESGGGYINISFKGKKGYMLSFAFKEIGITWFLTKEEAEQALKQTENAR